MKLWTEFATHSIFRQRKTYGSSGQGHGRSSATRHVYQHCEDGQANRIVNVAMATQRLYFRTRKGGEVCAGRLKHEGLGKGGFHVLTSSPRSIRGNAAPPVHMHAARHFAVQFHRSLRKT